MKLTPPKAVTFWIAFIFAALGIAAYFIKIPVISDNDIRFWFVVLAYLILAVANLAKGL